MPTKGIQENVILYVSKCLPYCNQSINQIFPLPPSRSQPTQQHSKMTSKLCFLTVGATASFTALIEAAVSPTFLAALEAQGYTELSVQYGQDGKQLFEKCKAAASAASSKVNVTGFDLDRLGLGKHMRRAKGGSGSNSTSTSKESAQEGVVISHAGKLGLSCSQ